MQVMHAAFQISVGLFFYFGRCCVKRDIQHLDQIIRQMKSKIEQTFNPK